mmetsp:Transcript_14863/g.28351  ORF Transcript_14863/g.28351 Transcript_14863/m.28351 type:complete len:235 (+) Transcript_14863:2737-3441(+)
MGPVPIDFSISPLAHQKQSFCCPENSYSVPPYPLECLSSHGSYGLYWITVKKLEDLWCVGMDRGHSRSCQRPLSGFGLPTFVPWYGMLIVWQTKGVDCSSKVSSHHFSCFVESRRVRLMIRNLPDEMASVAGKPIVYCSLSDNCCQLIQKTRLTLLAKTHSFWHFGFLLNGTKILIGSMTLIPFGEMENAGEGSIVCFSWGGSNRHHRLIRNLHLALSVSLLSFSLPFDEMASV